MNNLILVMLFLVGFAFTGLAQQQPYLLLQGPKKSKTYRFLRGQSLEWRLAGEDEFFSARIMELFPESQAIRIDDMILSMAKIAEVRHRRRGAGLRSYLQAQGVINLAIIGGYSAFKSDDRDRQKNFLIGAAVTSVAMVIVGSIDKNASREVGVNSSYVLTVGGGDLREGDDGERQ